MGPIYFKHAVVNDMAAAIGMPSLMTSSDTLPCLNDALFDEMLQHAMPWLKELDKEPAALLAHIKATPRSNRLGLYYEALLSFWFKEHAPWTMLAHELAVSQNKRTLGAYDFLVKTSEGVMHLEVAIKFYLGVKGSAEWFDWIGPGQNDCLGLKMEKMLSRQLKLSETPAGNVALKKMNISLPIQKQMWLKGICFRPHASDERSCPSQGVPAEGIWMPFSDLPNWVAKHSQDFWIPRVKPDWLARLVFLERPDHAVGPKELMRHVELHWKNNERQPVMWSLMSQDKGRWFEIQRIFIVPDDWLAAAEKLNWH